MPPSVLTLICFIELQAYPDSKVYGDNMGPTWVLLAPDGPHVGAINLAIRVSPRGQLRLGCDPLYLTPYVVYGWQKYSKCTRKDDFLAKKCVYTLNGSNMKCLDVYIDTWLWEEKDSQLTGP